MTREKGLRRFWKLQTISHPRLGQQELGIGGIGLDLLAKLFDEDAQVFGFVAVVGSPDGLQELAMWNRAVGMKGQITEKIELLRSEPDFLFLHGYRTGLEIDDGFAELHALRSAFGRHGSAAQGRTDTGEKLRRAKRLGDEIVRT